MVMTQMCKPTWLIMQEITRESQTILLLKVQQVLEKIEYNENCTVTIVKIKKDDKVQWKAIIIVQ